MKVFFTILAVAYVLWPQDLLPDFFMGWGWFDDLAVAISLWYLYGRLRKATAKNHTGRPHSDRKSYGFGLGEETVSTGFPSDPFDILEIERTADANEIRRAYRRLASRYHPDKVAHLAPEFQELAAQRFMAIQKAFEEIMGADSS